MCIVSFVPGKDNFVVTFNRDEDPARAFDEPVMHPGKDVFSPLDRLAGGTWIGCNSKSLMCLQNGGMEKHSREAPYQKSRGVMLVELLNDQLLDEVLESVHHIKTEPFTLSILDRGTFRLHLYYYDGKLVKNEEIDTKIAFVNFSSTLYDKYSQEQIRAEFKLLDSFEPDSVLQFHLDHCIGGPKNNYVNKPVSTTSITQFIFNKGNASCVFVNMQTGYTKTYDLSEMT